MRAFPTVCAIAIPAMLAQAPCPPVLAAIMPGNAANVAGQYTAAGMIGIGFAAADLPFKHDCLTAVKFPGKVTFDVKHYSGQGVKLFQGQIDAEEQQRFKNEAEELARRYKHQVSGEGSNGAKMAYVAYESSCEPHADVPFVALVAMTHTDSTAINIRVEGRISLTVAKGAADEVLRNFARAKFD